MKKNLLIGVVLASLLLTACGQSPKVVPSGVYNTLNSVFFSSPSDSAKYVLTNEKVSRVGKEIFYFHGSDTMSQGPGWETNDSDVSGVYEIPRVDTATAVAVKLKDGTYVKATVVGHQWVDSFGNNQANEYYVLTKTSVSNVGHLIPRVNLATNGPGGWGASTDQVVAVYAIPGVDNSKAVAVRLKDGSYVRANATATQKP